MDKKNYDTFFNGCAKQEQAMYKVEVYRTCPYRIVSINYFADLGEGKYFADNYFEDNGYDSGIDYEEFYREYEGGPWVVVIY